MKCLFKFKEVTPPQESSSDLCYEPAPLCSSLLSCVFSSALCHSFTKADALRPEKSSAWWSGTCGRRETYIQSHHTLSLEGCCH